MKELTIGKILLAHRRQRGITQDALAAWLGVSKASVSKWETGTTYPDITLLPQLAAFFHLTIDELMGYEPQLTQEEIRRLHRQLSADFSAQPWEPVMARCRALAKKYFACMPLLLELGTLYVNHSNLAPTPQATRESLEEAQALFRRVKAESGDLSLARQALHMEALCALTLGRPKEAKALLEPLDLPLSYPEPMLAKAYQALQQPEKARQILQAGVYRTLCELFNTLPTYLSLCIQDPAAFRETWRRIQALVDAFQVKTLHPTLLLSVYLGAARGFLALGEEDTALDLLEAYTDLATGDIYPLRLHGDAFFDQLDRWMEDTLTLGRDLPRDEALVRKSMTQALTAHPAFAPLADHFRFQALVGRLRANEEVAP